MAAENHTFLRGQSSVVYVHTNCIPALASPTGCWQWGHMDVIASWQDMVGHAFLPHTNLSTPQNLCLVIKKNLTSQNWQTCSKIPEDYFSKLPKSWNNQIKTVTFQSKLKTNNNYTQYYILEKILVQKNKHIHARLRRAYINLECNQWDYNSTDTPVSINVP